MDLEPRRVWTSRGANLTLLLFGTLVSLLLLEGALRLLDPLPQRLRGDRLQLPHDLRYDIDNTHNPRLERHIVHTKNALGFRGPGLPRDRRGALIAFAVGGSTTECFYLSDGQDWPARVGALLQGVFPRFRIDNAGLDGHSTFGHALLLDQRILDLQPQVVLFLIGANDIGRADLNDYDLAAERATARPVPLATRLARHSLVVATVLNIWRSEQARRRGLGHTALDLARAPRVAFKEAPLRRTLARHERLFLPAYRERVQGLVDRCRRRGILPVLITQPALLGPAVDDVTGLDLGTIALDASDWQAGREWNGAMAWALFESYNDVVRAQGRASDVPVIDLARRLPKSSRFFYDMLHFTNEGAEAVAHIVADELCPLLATSFPGQAVSGCGPAGGLGSGSERRE